MADKTSNELQDFDKYSGAVAHYTQKTVSRIIKEWYLYTLKRKILVELESYVRGERVQRAKSRILRDWFELSMRERLNSATEDYLVSKRNQAILRNVWSFWYKNHYLQKRNEYRTYSHLRGIFLNRLLREAFLLWHTEILDARECLRFQKNGLQRRAFSEWRSEFHRVLAARSLLETQRKRRLFLGYLQYVRSRKERRHFAKAKLDEFESIQLARIFNQWIILVQYSLNKRYTILEWQIGLVNHRMTQMLRGWKLVVLQKKLERSKLLQAIKSQQDKTLLKSFNMWYVLAQESYKEKAMLIISGLSARRHLLVLGFSSLRIYLTHRRQSRILKERSESYLASYLLKVFKRNSSSYAAYKIKLQGAQNLFEKGVAKVCWSQWRQYLLHKKALRSKEGQIRLKYLGRILQKSYKIWNYVWFKTVTNRMIVDCIQVKMGIHVKKTVFYSMLYIFRISKSQFWGIFKQLIARQLKTGFEKLRSQMFEARNQQVLEDQLADRIRQSVLFHRWRALALESQKISRSQLRVIVFRFLSGMREVSALRRRQQELAAVRDSRLGLRVFQSWRLQSRRLANLGNIFQSTSIQAVSRRITMSSYFGKWLAEFSRRRRLVEFTLVGERALKSKVLVIWRCLCARRSLNREKHDRVFGQISHRIRSHFFGRWIQRYRRRRTNREKLAQLVQSKDQRRTRRCLVEMMRVSEVRRSRRRAVQQSLEGLGRLILSKAWLKMKQHFFLERSLERISNKYLSRINYKRLDLIYRHWRFVTARIREIRGQERISEDHFLLCLQRKTLLAWRASLDHELARQGLICQIVQSRSCERQTELLRSITQSWRGLVLRHAELRGKERIILLRAKRRSLDAMIGLFNRVNHFKKRVLDSMHYEFVNSSFFKLQYKRVVQQKRQAGITLQISLEMYQSYSLLKRGMERWLRSMTERIRQRETLQREMELMELRMAFLRLRASFHKLADWASYLGLKEVEARDRVRVRACRAVMGELRRQAEERRFTVQVSDLLYRNFVMRRLLHGLSFWKEKSRYQRECQYKASVLESRIKRRGKFKALIFWRSRSSEYVRYFRLRRSIEVPIKRRVFQALRANSLASRVQEADLRMRLGAWRALSEKKRCLRARCGEFSSGYVLRRLQRRVLGSWRKAYHQKLHVYEFHDRVVKRRPVEKIMAVWSRRSRERLRREGELRRKVQEREKGHLLRSVRVMFRAARMGLEMNKRSLARVFAEWRRLQSVERLKRYRILGQCLGNWRAYSCARIANRERYDSIVRRRSGRLLEESFIRLTGEYSRRMVVREKGECVMMSRVAREKREIFERWVGRWVQRRRRREICERVSLVHVRCVLGMSLRFWRERLQKEERYRWILDHQLKAMESRVRSKVFNGWRSIWRPYHYLKVSKEMIHVLNRLVLHESFHRLLRATFYACNIRRDEDEGVTGGFGFGSGPGEQKTSIELSYFAECRCSERELRSLSGRSEVVGLLSRMRGLRDGAILDMLMKMSGYVRRRQRYEKGICGLETRLRTLVLSRVWVRFVENIREIWDWRLRMGIIRERREFRAKREALVLWVGVYNRSLRNRRIVEYMWSRYGSTLRVKCYLIWSIKYEISKRKRILSERSERFLRCYTLEYGMRRMNEYYLYSKWQVWCRKAYETIEWVHEFRIKSLLFIGWRRHSARQKSLKSGLLGLYSRVRRRVLEERMGGWLRMTRSLRVKKEQAERFYLEVVVYRGRLVGYFYEWRRLTLRLRDQRARVWAYLESRSRSLKMTCFKLWRFFIYYRKTRNSRFEKITSIIETSHHNLIKFRIFYSWKLKVIEHRSLKNSIISFWNSGGMKEGDDPESGSDLEKAHLNSDHHLSERNEISPQTPLRLSASSLSREEPRYEDKSEIGFMDIFSSSGSDLDSPTRTQAELVKDRESEGLEDSKELPSLGREYVNRLFSSSETDSDSSFFTPVAKSGPGIRPSPPPKILQEPPLHPNPNPRKALQEQLPQGGGVRDPSDTRARILSPFASNPYSDGDLDIEELRSAQAMRRDGIQPKPSQLPDISPLPSPRIPPPQHSNHASPPHPTTYSIWNKASPNPFIPARQPQIHDSELLHADSTSSLPSSLASPPTFSYPNHPILMQNNNSTNTSLQDLPQNPYFISSPSPHQIHHHSLHPPNQILSESDTELSSP